MKLFEPGSIGRLSLKNRLVMAPMAVGALGRPDGTLSPAGIDYYITRAKGGVGLVTIGAVRVTRDREQPANIPLVRNLLVGSDVYGGWLSEVAEGIHDYGAKVAVQLGAGLGRVASVAVLKDSGDIAAPSAGPCYYNPAVNAREFRTEEIEEMVHACRRCAEFVRAAGADAIEIHGHGGYIIDQFMTPLWNRRTDKYGKDFEGRLRFPLELIKAIKEGAGADFPVIFRFAVTHYMDGGRTVEEGLELIRRLEEAGVDAISADAGCQETSQWVFPPLTQPPGCMVDMAEMVRKVVKIPVIAAGRLWYPDLAEKVLQEGKADFIALGRPLLADPEWPNKARAGRRQDICPCIGCLEGCLKRISEGKYISCAVNPATGKEREFQIAPAAKKKSVLVIGGGPGGMEAARVSALRGHKVTLCEKRQYLGGNLTAAAVPEWKRDYRALIDYLSRQLIELNVTVKLGKEVTPDWVRAAKPDVIFIATGSTPGIPDIPGLKESSAVTAIDLLLGHKRAGQRVVVVGGGLVGCELALHLANTGRSVTVVEMLDTLAGDAHPVNRSHLLMLLAHAGVKTLVGITVRQFKNSSVVVTDKAMAKTAIESDTVALATGMKPDQRLLETFSRETGEVYAIADCVEPRKVMSAIWEAFRAARLV